MGWQKLPMWKVKNQLYRIEQIIILLQLRIKWDKNYMQVTPWGFPIHKLWLYHMNAFHWIMLGVPNVWVFHFTVWSEQEILQLFAEKNCHSSLSPSHDCVLSIFHCPSRSILLLSSARAPSGSFEWTPSVGLLGLLASGWVGQLRARRALRRN